MIGSFTLDAKRDKVRRGLTGRCVFQARKGLPRLNFIRFKMTRWSRKRKVRATGIAYTG